MTSTGFRNKVKSKHYLLQESGFGVFIKKRSGQKPLLFHPDLPISYIVVSSIQEGGVLWQGKK
jgi:hypothetical protein